jgi:predicted RNase H-like HicB family nuclease
MTIKVVVHKAKEGGYWAEVPGLPGCYTQGETYAELGRNVREAVETWFATAAAERREETGGRLREVEV